MLNSSLISSFIRLVSTISSFIRLVSTLSSFNRLVSTISSFIRLVSTLSSFNRLVSFTTLSFELGLSFLCPFLQDPFTRSVPAIPAILLLPFPYTCATFLCNLFLFPLTKLYDILRGNSHWPYSLTKYFTFTIVWTSTCLVSFPGPISLLLSCLDFCEQNLQAGFSTNYARFYLSGCTRRIRWSCEGLMSVHNEYTGWSL